MENLKHGKDKEYKTMFKIGTTFRVGNGPWVTRVPCWQYGRVCSKCGLPEEAIYSATKEVIGRVSSDPILCICCKPDPRQLQLILEGPEMYEIRVT